MAQQPVADANEPVASGDSGSTPHSLIASEIRFRRLFEAAQDGILILNAETGEITAANPFIRDLLGYSDTEILGKKLWEISPFEDEEKSKIAFSELQSQDYIRYDDLPLETRDGRLIAVEFVSNVYRSGQDRVIQCNIRDITERYAATKAKQTSDERYRALFDYSPGGIIISDSEGRYIDVNASMCRLLGYTRSELIGMHSASLLAPAEAPNVVEALVQIHGATESRRQWQFQRKDGSQFPADVMATAMPDGNILAIVRDVTDYNLAQTAVRVSEARTLFALESAHVGIWDMDYTTNALTWSAEMETQYGLPHGSFDGTFESFTARIHPSDRAAAVAVMQKGKETGGDFMVNHRIVLPTGETRWLSGTGRIIHDEAGRPVRGVGISLDVTERHSLEAEFHQSQKMDAMGRLAGGVAHDFNNLLTVILASCEILLEDLAPGDPSGPDLHHIEAAATRAAGLTRQLLAFSRKEIVEPTRLDLNAILTEMGPMLGRLIRENIRISLTVSPGLAPIKADRGQIEQVILNLAINAQDAMPHGGTLTIQSDNAVLDDRYASTHPGGHPGPYVRLTMSDTGAGMTPGTLARLFEPFFTTKEVGKGTGLGLATVHGIVTGNGGSIHVTSEPGCGSSFEVYLPQTAITENEACAVPPAVQVITGTEHILVVEDDAVLREVTRRLLERQGYTVIVAATTAQAFRLFRHHAVVDLLLTDVVMPGHSGPELARELLQRRPGLKVLYMSGYNDEAVVHNGLVNPGIAFLHKPFTSDALGRKVRAVLDAPNPTRS